MRCADHALEYRKLADIKPYQKNPRKNDKAVTAVANSIREYGFQSPIIVDKDGVIIAGHTRYKAAKRLRLSTVPVIVAAELTPEQVKELRIADNSTSEVAEWDLPVLSAELAQLTFDPVKFGLPVDLLTPEQPEEPEPEAVYGNTVTPTPIVSVSEGRRAKHRAARAESAAEETKAQQEKRELKEHLARARAGIAQTAAADEKEKDSRAELLRSMDPKEQERILKEVLREFLS